MESNVTMVNKLLTHLERDHPVVFKSVLVERPKLKMTVRQMTLILRKFNHIVHCIPHNIMECDWLIR